MSAVNSKLGAGRPSTGKSQKTLSDLADKADKKEKARVNFDVTPTQHKKLKVYAAQQGKTVKEVLTDFVDQLPE